MTDWMPWAGVFMIGVFATLWLLIAAVRDAGATGGAADLTNVRRAFWATVAATVLVYLLYIIVGEDWIPYA